MHTPGECTEHFKGIHRMCSKVEASGVLISVSKAIHVTAAGAGDMGYREWGASMSSPTPPAHNFSKGSLMHCGS